MTRLRFKDRFMMRFARKPPVPKPGLAQTPAYRRAAATPVPDAPRAAPATQDDERGPGVLSRMGTELATRPKNWVVGTASDVCERPVRALFWRTLANKYVWAASLLFSSSASGVNMYVNESKRTIGGFVEGAMFNLAYIALYVDEKLNLSKIIPENQSNIVYGMGALAAFTVLTRDSLEKMIKRASYASLFVAAPTVFPDVVTQVENGTRGIVEMVSNLSAESLTLGGITIGTYLLSWLVPQTERRSPLQLLWDGITYPFRRRGNDEAGTPGEPAD